MQRFKSMLPPNFAMPLSLSLLVLILIPLAFSTSFYDNPEQDPTPPQGLGTAEEVHRKWDFEVYT